MAELQSPFVRVVRYPRKQCFKHRSTKEELWIQSWRTSQLFTELSEKKQLPKNAGGYGIAGGEVVEIRCGPRDAVNFRSSKHNEFFWTVQITRHTRSGQGRQALKMFGEMQKEGVELSRYTFVALLKACSKLQDLESAKRFHAEVIKRGFESDLHVGTMLVDVYTKCERLVDARCVFEKMAKRDVVPWSVMILGYAQIGEGGEALQLYRRMVQEGVEPNGRTFVGALKACSNLAACNSGNKEEGLHGEEQWLDQVRTIHSDIVKWKFDSDVFVENTLVDTYAKCGGLEDARCVFEKMHHRDVVSWNAVIFGYAQSNEGEEAMQLYARMQQEGVVPDNRTYVGALKACSSIAEIGRCDGMPVKNRCLEVVRGIHADVVKRRFESDVFVGSMLVDAYSKCESLENARTVFDKMTERTVVCWNAMILGYAQMGKGEESLHLFARMQQEGLLPDDRTYVSVLKACSSLVEMEKLRQGDVRHVGERCLEIVRRIHRAVLLENLESDVFVGTALVDAYAKCGSMEDARRVFEKMPHRSVASWNAMILGYAQIDEGEEALRLFAQLQHEGVVPNDRTYVAALKACGNVAGLEKGKEIHIQILNAGTVAHDSFVTHSLIDMYSKCGNMEDAHMVFDAMATREIVAWNALIAGYANQGESDLVFDLFERMKQEGVQPNGITFLAILTACSHGGLLVRGQKCFEAMSRDYGITPTLAHYTSVIDLVGRSGQVQKAMEMVKRMPFQPDSALWECILGACRKWKNVKVERQASECALRLNRHSA